MMSFRPNEPTFPTMTISAATLELFPRLAVSRGVRSLVLGSGLVVVLVAVLSHGSGPPF